MKATYTEATRVQIAIHKKRIDIIQAVVCDFYDIPLKTSQSHSRKGQSIAARRSIHFLCREFVPHCPLAIIGLLTGNGKAFDHATVSHSANALVRDMNAKTPSGKLIYPKVSEDIFLLRLRIGSAFLEMKEPANIEFCPKCGHPIIK